MGGGGEAAVVFVMARRWPAGPLPDVRFPVLPLLLGLRGAHVHVRQIQRCHPLIQRLVERRPVILLDGHGAVEGGCQP